VPILTQVGVKDEVTYGTPVVVDRFYEFNSESVTPNHARIESAGLRSDTRVQRSDRFVPNFKGAAGAFSLDVMTKGFGWWLKHMLGTSATVGPTDSAYTHTGTVGSLLGDMFTWQVNRKFNDAETDQAFTYEGGKVTSWEIACAVDGLLTAMLNLDFEDELTATGLATASYPTAMDHLSYAGGALTIGGTSVPITDFKVAVDNGFKTERYHLRSSTRKKQPSEAKRRNITWEVVADFDALTQYNRVKSTTAAGALAQIIATFTGPTLIGSSTYPSLTITIPAARFDGTLPTIDGEDPLMQTLSGRGLFDGSLSPITVAYVSLDATA